MKKYLFSFSLLFLFWGFASSQTYNVTVDGTALDSLGNPVQNQMIYISFDSAFCGGAVFYYFDSVATDSNGYFSVTVAVPLCNTGGNLNVWLNNCNSLLTRTFAFSNAPCCSNFTCTLVTCTGGTPPATMDISGVVIDSTNGFIFRSYSSMAQVYLITYDSAMGSLTAIDSTLTDTNGNYHFYGLPVSNYLIKAALLPSAPNYSWRMPTYFGDVLLWSTAITVSSGTSAGDITLVPGSNPGGPGFIGGLVSQGANKRMGPGDPMAHVQVILFDNSMNPVLYTYTDANGIFSFPALAYGTYKVWPEVAGKTTTPIVVTISAMTPSITNVNLAVNSGSILAGYSIPDQDMSKEIKTVFYPNPVNANGTLSVTMPEAANGTIRFSDLSGKVVFSQSVEFRKGNNSWMNDYSTIAPGIYFLEIQTEGKRILEKIVRN